MTDPTPDEPGTSADTPSQIGRYALEEVVGTGAFATVHRAYDQRLGDTVAVKLLAENHSLDPEARERFISEGRALRLVASPHVIRVHDMGETDSQQPYLVLEYADRGTLAQRVKEWAGPDGTAWSATRADILLVARSLAAATDALHRVDLVHRDMSPGNILLRSTVRPGVDLAHGLAGVRDLPSGEVPRIDDTSPPPGGGPATRGLGVTLLQEDEQLVLADLGLVKDLAAHSGMTVGAGTEGFRPPEQRGGSGWVDARADLWALSALLVWLVTGEPPGDDPDQVAPALATKGFTRPLAEALARSLAESPAGRHPDVPAWLDDVENALTTASSTPSGSSPARPVGDTGGSGSGAVPSEIVARPTPPWRSRLPRPPGWGRPKPPPPPTGVIHAPRRRRSAGRVIVALLIGAALGAAVVAYLTGDGDSGGSVSRTGDGSVRVTDSVSDAELSLLGPESVAVGEVATFSVEASGTGEWVWLMPDGSVAVGEPSMSIRPSTPGVAVVSLAGVSTDGDRLLVEHEVTVTR